MNAIRIASIYADVALIMEMMDPLFMRIVPISLILLISHAMNVHVLVKCAGMEFVICGMVICILIILIYHQVKLNSFVHLLIVNLQGKFL